MFGPWDSAIGTKMHLARGSTGGPPNDVAEPHAAARSAHAAAASMVAWPPSSPEQNPPAGRPAHCSKPPPPLKRHWKRGSPPLREHVSALVSQASCPLQPRHRHQQPVPRRSTIVTIQIRKKKKKTWAESMPEQHSRPAFPPPPPEVPFFYPSSRRPSPTRDTSLTDQPVHCSLRETDPRATIPTSHITTSLSALSAFSAPDQPARLPTRVMASPDGPPLQSGPTGQPQVPPGGRLGSAGIDGGSLASAGLHPRSSYHGSHGPLEPPTRWTRCPGAGRGPIPLPPARRSPACRLPKSSKVGRSQLSTVRLCASTPWDLMSRGPRMTTSIHG